MTNETELKPCSFCGKDAFLDFIESARYKDSDKYLVICNGCINQTNSYLYKQAIDAWNTRAKTQECERCDRIDKWTQHVGCTPTILEKYKKAIEFIKDSANDQDHRFSPAHKQWAQKLLRELGEIK